MDIDLKHKDHLFQTAFPHPIAAPYRMAVSAHNPVERLAHVVATVDGLARYLATVLITDLLRQSPDAQVVRDLVERMRVATIGGWIGIVEEILTSRPDADWFIKPMATRLLRGGGKPSKALVELRALADTAGALFEDRDIHQPQKAAAVLEKLEPELRRCLAPLAFLADYPLGMIRTQAGGLEDEAFHGTFNRWMGHRPAPLPISVALESEPPKDVMLVVSPEFDRALVLHPFAEVRGEADGQRFFLLSGMHSPSSIRMSSYTGHLIGATALEVEGVAVDLPVWLGAWTNGATIAALVPSRDTVARMRSRSRLLPDEKLFDGTYANLGFIGRGGIGAVYRLVEVASGEDRAIKILYPDLGRNETFTRYFLETGEWLAGVNYPGLVKVLSASYSSKLQQHHITMEYLSGGSLDDWLIRREILPRSVRSRWRFRSWRRSPTSIGRGGSTERSTRTTCSSTVRVNRSWRISASSSSPRTRSRPSAPWSASTRCPTRRRRPSSAGAWGPRRISTPSASCSIVALPGVCRIAPRFARPPRMSCRCPSPWTRS